MSHDTAETGRSVDARARHQILAQLRILRQSMINSATVTER